MGNLLARLRQWRRLRQSAQVWVARVERDRSAIGRFSDSLQARLADTVPAKALHDVLVAFDELLTNVIMHAEQTAGPIDVELRYGPRAIEATISYFAAEFDPTLWRAAPSGMTLAGSRIGGLGITLVRSLMDEFRYEFVDGRNVLRLVKRC
jgi:anti-sigma regulatory factor (Ser/Thr protein kinase)